MCPYGVRRDDIQTMAEVKLCECGCGGVTLPMPYTNKTRGMTKGEPARFVCGHNRRKKEEEMYLVDAATGCWMWLLGTSDGRYGMIGCRPAHCVLYEKYRGKIPEGLELDHLCRVTLCVNPDHMEPVTSAINIQRSSLAKLTAEQVVVIRDRYREGLSAVSLADEYGVTTSNIYMITTRRSWKNIK